MAKTKAAAVKSAHDYLFQREGMPPVGEMIPCALQHVLASFAGIITPAILIAATFDFTAQQKTDIIQVALILSAIDTALQAFAPFRRIGGNLPIVMGVSFAFLPALQAMGATFSFGSLLGGEIVGGIAKFVSPIKEQVVSALNLKPNDFVALSAGKLAQAQKTAGVLVKTLGAAVPGHMDKEQYAFCWIVDFPMYEIGDESGELEFCHNPFSMPSGGLDVLLKAEKGEIDPLTITADQYDLVCNGVELSSGAVRNHDPEIMIKAFELVRLGEEDVKAKFPAMYNAFTYGAPPHAGIAPGVDRMVMLLAGEDSIREIIPFPMNKNAQDVMMSAPSEVTQKQLDELHIQITKLEN